METKFGFGELYSYGYSIRWICPSCELITTDRYNTKGNNSFELVDSICNNCDQQVVVVVAYTQDRKEIRIDAVNKSDRIQAEE